jgi:trans-aconitate methyltransferase
LHEIHRDDWNAHWDVYSEAASYNPAQEYRRQVIVELLGLSGTGVGVRILDVGSGQGDMALAIRHSFPDAEILGLELSRSGVEISETKVPDARFLQRNLLEAAEVPADQRNWATHAICSEVLEHVDAPVQLLRSAREYMHLDAVLVVTVPGGPMSAFDKHIGHRQHFQPDDLKQVLRQAGYRVELAEKAGFPFFNLYRCVVILRGQNLIEDVNAQNNLSGSRLARAVMGVFHWLFRANIRSSPWGWQMVAKARPRPLNANG